MKEISFEEALDIALTQRQMTLATGGKVRRPTRKEVEQTFLETFELVGGVPRLAVWANNPANYGEFLKLYAKMIPKEVAEEAGQTFIYQSNVPPSALNKPALTTKIDEPEVGDDSAPE
jgi:hypothetical protein